MIELEKAVAMIDPEVKKKLDLRLATGEVTRDEYESILESLTWSDAKRRTGEGKTPYTNLETGFTVRVLEPGTLLRDRYEIVELLGRGGMGAVYKAHDRVMKKDYAVKVLPWEVGANPDAYALFLKEAQTAMELRHPNIMAVHNLDRDGETAFLVMELIDGPTLVRKILQEGKITSDDVIRIGIECCEALAHAHGKKVLHRDIKPQNIMLTSTGQVKLCDFGLSTELRDSLSRTSGKHVAGTLLYMPPEQLDADGVDERSDLYALGMTLYECLAGRHPWLGAGDVTHLVRTKVPPRLPFVLSPLMDLIDMLLAKDKYRRPRDVRTVKMQSLALTGVAGAAPTDSLLDIAGFGQPSGPRSEPVSPIVPRPPGEQDSLVQGLQPFERQQPAGRRSEQPIAQPSPIRPGAGAMAPCNIPTAPKPIRTSSLPGTKVDSFSTGEDNPIYYYSPSLSRVVTFILLWTWGLPVSYLILDLCYFDGRGLSWALDLLNF